VYFIYGMHWCFNAVTGPEGRPSAVLVRGLEPAAGFDGPLRLDGPGRLCRALDITGADNGLDLVTSGLRILDAPAIAGRALERGPRIGVDYAEEWAERPLRFWVRDSPGVSRERRSRAVR
jgi:DNA-3-methyladenine glycosylase